MALIVLGTVGLISTGFVLGRRSGDVKAVSTGESHATLTTTTPAPAPASTSVPPTTAAPQAPPSTVATTAPQVATTTVTVAATTTTIQPKVSVRGVINIVWFIAEIDPPSGCPGLENNYQVQVRDGSATVLAIASYNGVRQVRREYHPDTQATILECEFPYHATVDPHSVYILALVETSADASTLDKKTLAESDVRAGKIPTLSAYFACTVSAGCAYR